MGRILSLETTTTNCSVALGQEGKISALKELNSKNYSHAEKLHLFIKAVLEEAECTLSDIDAVAVSKGPGSYTGLRIGVSAAKGLCFSKDLPLLAIDTLEVLASQNTSKDYTYIIPLLDARRMEVYTAVFDTNLKKQTPTEAKIVDASSYAKYLDQGQVLFIGNAVKKFKEICSHPNAHFKETWPSAKDMVASANRKYKISDTVDVAYFEPFYLKDFHVKSKAKN